MPSEAPVTNAQFLSITDLSGFYLFFAYNYMSLHSSIFSRLTYRSLEAHKKY